jgi:hypothetical protein
MLGVTLASRCSAYGAWTETPKVEGEQMASNMPGPLCGWSLGYGWMDSGTLALTRNECPGPTGVAPLKPFADRSPPAATPDDSLLEQIRQQFIIGSMIGLRKGLATVNPLGMQDVATDEQQAMLLLAQGDYEQAFEVATGFQAYFKINRQSKLANASGGETAVAMVGHLTGFNQATAAATGEDINGNPLGAGDRIMSGIDGLLRIASTTMTVSGVVGGAGARLRSGRVVSTVYRIAGRDVVIVETSVGRQAFYRSSGVNSNLPGEWLPVDEFRTHDGWFNKAAYVHGPGRELGQPLHRFGSEEFQRISQRLGQMHIPAGAQAPRGRLDSSAEATLNHILDFFGARRTPTTMQRPMPEPPTRRK